MPYISSQIPRVSRPSAFVLHRAALAPAVAGASAASIVEALAEAYAGNEAHFIRFAVKHGLGPVWHRQLEFHGLQRKVSPAAFNKLRNARLAASALYLQQHAAIQRIDAAFASRSIPYAVIKGAHVRELIYPEPALRPAADVDLLVAREHREAAAELLTACGLRHCPNPAIASHEAAFLKGDLNVDLHWNVLRPGRTRYDLTPELLGRRRRLGGFWVLDDADAVFLMLVHPAFAKYVCSPHMDVCRVMDFIRWTEMRGADWDAVAALLAAAGVKTAAWTVLCWFAMLGAAVPDALVNALRPGGIRARYLRFWLERDLPSRWLQWPLLIQFGLTLFLHDRISDVWRAMAEWLQAYFRRNRNTLLVAGQPGSAGFLIAEGVAPLRDKAAATVDALRAIAAERELRVIVGGECMSPFLNSGARVSVKPRKWYLPGDCLVFADGGGKLTAHRLIGYYYKGKQFRYLTQADHASRPDRYVLRRHIIGRIDGGDCDPRLVNVPAWHRLRAAARFCGFVLAKCRTFRA